MYKYILELEKRKINYKYFTFEVSDTPIELYSSTWNS